jgi:hypothetical protein
MRRTPTPRRRAATPTARPRKEPEQWTTGEEPMTMAQWAYLTTLSEEAGEPLDDTLTKAQASQRIEELQRQTGRGASTGAPPRSRPPGGPGPRAKDPAEWATGEEPMTSAQRSYLGTLAEEAGAPVEDTLTKAQAAQRIDALQRQTGRGRPSQAQGRRRARGAPAGKRQAYIRNTARFGDQPESA